LGLWLDAELLSSLRGKRFKHKSKTANRGAPGGLALPAKGRGLGRARLRRIESPKAVACHFSYMCCRERRYASEKGSIACFLALLRMLEMVTIPPVSGGADA